MIIPHTARYRRQQSLHGGTAYKHQIAAGMRCEACKRSLEHNLLLGSRCVNRKCSRAFRWTP